MGTWGGAGTVATAPSAGGTYSRKSLSQEAPTADGLKSEGPEGRDWDTATPLPRMAEERGISGAQAWVMAGSPSQGHCPRGDVSTVFH